MDGSAAVAHAKGSARNSLGHTTYSSEVVQSSGAPDETPITTTRFRDGSGRVGRPGSEGGGVADLTLRYTEIVCY